jgi:hypothetical protein
MKGEWNMKLKFWMVAKAVIVAIFGIGFLLIPATLASIYGMTLTDTGTLMARLFGGGFIFEAIVLYLSRNTDRDDVANRAIVIGVVVSNAIGFIVCLLATLAGTWNALGWLSVALFLVFGLVFAYFLFIKKSA